MLRNLLICLAFLISGNIYAQYPTGQAYIERYKIIAIKESQRTGIPASIKLGQAILESGAGSSKLAEKANNHFGIKCGSNWNGDSYGLKDDERGFLFFKKKSCFRKYNNAEESFIDHSEFIRRPNGPYQPLFNLDPKDYKAWAYGLKKAGYATASDYPQKLIGVIERYQLYQFDGGTPIKTDPSQQPVVVNEPKKSKEPIFTKKEKPIRINMVKAYIAKGGEKVSDVASKYDVPESYILAYNDYLKSPNQLLKENDIVYLQKKKKSFWGKKKIHYVTAGQTIFDIAQQYGVREENLRERNMLNMVDQPDAGQKVYLRGKLPKNEKIKTIKAMPVQTETPKSAVDTLAISSPNAETKTNPSQVQVKQTPKEPANGNNDLLDFYVVPQEKKSDSTQTAKPDTSTFKPAITGVNVPSTPVVTKVQTTQQDPVTKTEQAAQPNKNQSPGTDFYHTVDKGDTLYNISKRYNTTVAKIKEINQLASDYITIGQRLLINHE